MQIKAMTWVQDVTLDDKELVVPLGKFRIFVSPGQGVLVRPAGNNVPNHDSRRRGDLHFKHPHVQNEKLCQGDAQVLIRRAHELANLDMMFDTVSTTVNTYNPGSPYIRLEMFLPRCTTCNEAMGRMVSCCMCGNNTPSCRCSFVNYSSPNSVISGTVCSDCLQQERVRTHQCPICHQQYSVMPEYVTHVVPTGGRLNGLCPACCFYVRYGDQLFVYENASVRQAHVNALLAQELGRLFGVTPFHVTHPAWQSWLTASVWREPTPWHERDANVVLATLLLPGVGKNKSVLFVLNFVMSNVAPVIDRPTPLTLELCFSSTTVTSRRVTFATETVSNRVFNTSVYDITQVPEKIHQCLMMANAPTSALPPQT